VLLLAAGLLVQQLTAFAAAVEYRLAANVARARLNAAFAAPAIVIDEGERLDPAAAPLVVECRPGGACAHVSFTAAPGEVVALSGLPADAASALMRTIAGLHPPEGEAAGVAVRLGDAELGRVRRRDWWRAVALVCDDLPQPQGTLANAARLGARAGGKAEEDRVLARFGIDGLQRGAEGSRRARAAARAARAVLRGARVVLVDEAAVLGEEEILGSLLDELARQGAIVVLAGPHPHARAATACPMAEPPAAWAVRGA